MTSRYTKCLVHCVTSVSLLSSEATPAARPAPPRVTSRLPHRVRGFGELRLRSATRRCQIVLIENYIFAFAADICCRMYGHRISYFKLFTFTQLSYLWFIMKFIINRFMILLTYLSKICFWFWTCDALFHLLLRSLDLVHNDIFCL